MTDTCTPRLPDNELERADSTSAAQPDCSTSLGTCAQRQEGAQAGPQSYESAVGNAKVSCNGDLCANSTEKTDMPGIQTEFLFSIALEVEVFSLGDTPYGSRRIVRFGTGTVEGPKLKGTVLPGGAGWTLLRRDDVLEIEVRVTLETDDKQHIYMAWKGLRHGPKEVIARLNRGEDVDPTTYYFRTTPYFETGSSKYGWLNRICSIATGTLTRSGRSFKVFRVL
jgi:uncharacterized protein DUF3237